MPDDDLRGTVLQALRRECIWSAAVKADDWRKAFGYSIARFLKDTGSFDFPHALRKWSEKTGRSYNPKGDFRYVQIAAGKEVTLLVFKSVRELNDIIKMAQVEEIMES